MQPTVTPKSYAGSPPGNAPWADLRPARFPHAVEGYGMTERPLKLYSDRAYLPAGLKHSLMLIPFWGNPHPHDGYAKFARDGASFLRMTTLRDADFAVLPFDGSNLLPAKEGINHEAIGQAKRFVEVARAAGLRTIVLVNSDSDEPIRLPDVLVFRTSLSRRTRRANEFALPAWHEDLVSEHLDGQIVHREWSQAPVIGFCGHAASTRPRLRRYVKLLIQKAVRPLGFYIKHNDGIYLRRKVMHLLENSPLVKTNFITRSNYYAGPNNQLQHMRQARREYIDNIIQSDYTLCARGYGNFSFRFFEAMSLGRAPLLIDTDCVLPFSSLHDYSQYCISVPDDQLGQAARAAADHHAQFGPESYHEFQTRIRDFWVRWLSPQGFFRNLALHWSNETVRSCAV